MPLIKKSTDWLFLASLSIALAGLFSIIIVFARVPFIKEILPFGDLFRTALVIHVDLSQIFWFMCIAIALSLQTVGTDNFINKIFKKITIISLILISIAPFNGGLPILSNYVPFIDDNLAFSLSIGLFFTLIILYNLYFLTFSKTIKKDIYFELQKANQISILIAFLTLFLTVYVLKKDFPIGEFYEYIFWGFGHVLQYSYCFIIMFIWLKFCDYNSNFPKSLKTIIWIHAFFALITLSFFLSPDINIYKNFYTKSMRLLAIAPCILLILLILDRENIKLKSETYQSYYLTTSVILFLAGGFIAFFIKESNTIIPAHYHGSIVAITIAIMGYIFMCFHKENLIAKNLKIVKIIPLTYFAGQFMHISGLALSGGYGALRKSPDSLTNFYAKFWMGIMGMGGLIAIISGFLFIYVCYIAYRNLIKLRNA
ncbi:MAG: hypothetical protein ISQ32_04730 [Rickettsiales bacterium]|nr:hypothetical protein [Rickettsiales bacterium]